VRDALSTAGGIAPTATTPHQGGTILVRDRAWSADEGTSDHLVVHRHAGALLDHRAPPTSASGPRRAVRRRALPAKHASPVTVPLLIEVLHGDDEALRSWAARGLALVDTKDARKALWHARRTGQAS
jgi:hypothetical protein